MGPETDLDGKYTPSGLYDLLMKLKKEYCVEAIFITENGCSIRAPNEENKIKDQRRIDYHHTHLIEYKKLSMMAWTVKGILLGH